ncbi:MAG: membrane protein insertase YidC [Candidatus Loosdrechtia sp.]|uniref:membrane protein insertase YidC n=1 Tax=Candidatus Loosdrechtia sp. TaxID=3101272 RepID=UPI003A6026AF|nr:MAG: membrane protein insertase YidC [Candidatus Jettenia sp. AMX2]
MDRKTLIAIVVCGIIMLLYYPFILPLFTPKRPDTQGVQEEAVLKKTQEKEVAVSPEPLKPQPVQPAQPQEEIRLKDVVLENELVRMVWSNEGASLKSIKLKQFKDEERKDILDLIRSDKIKYLPLAIASILQKEDFQRQRYTIREHSSDRVVFTTSLEEGVNIVKNVSLPPGKYHVNVDIFLENTTGAPVSLSYTIIASSSLAREGDPSSDIASVVGIDIGSGKIKLAYTLPKDLPARNESIGITWGGAMNKYFATVLKPASSDWVASIKAQPVDKRGIPSLEGERDDFVVSLETNTLTVSPQSTVKHSYIYFTGPKKEEILAQYETLHALLNYGWLGSISKVLLSFLNAVYRVFPNYGISIIILTIIIKSMLFPLTRKSQISMFRMQQLQPMIKQLKEKYKHDKQRMGKEQMLLFKKYGVNPMSGCLPMLLQLPVFFALFRTLQLSFEMRQAPFLLWIDDLSRPDVLLLLPFAIPLLGNTLNILPLIMTGASFFQMKLAPKAPATDPQAQAQQKMMSFMPIMFAFILYNMPSGLTLYWTTSTVLSIVESVVIRKSIKKIKLQ